MQFIIGRLTDAKCFWMTESGINNIYLLLGDICDWFLQLFIYLFVYLLVLADICYFQLNLFKFLFLPDIYLFIGRYFKHLFSYSWISIGWYVIFWAKCIYVLIFLFIL